MLPKSDGLVLRVSLVYESKAGLSIRELTKIQRFYLMWWGLMVIFFLFFFSIAVLSLLTI